LTNWNWQSEEDFLPSTVVNSFHHISYSPNQLSILSPRLVRNPVSHIYHEPKNVLEVEYGLDLNLDPTFHIVKIGFESEWYVTLESTLYNNAFFRIYAYFFL
jgi:hypothetical protein